MLSATHDPTVREETTVVAIATGVGLKVIATSRGATENTVMIHVIPAYRRLGARPHEKAYAAGLRY